MRQATRFLLPLALLAAPAIAAPPASTASNVDVPTWSSDVAPLLHAKCTQCHAPNQSAPMSLRTYSEARPWAKSIARNVEARTMPPWHAVAGHRAFANDRSLTDVQVDTIVRWAKSGAPAGDLEAAPEPPPIPTGEWKLGEPDLVVTFEEVEIPAEGPDEFRDLIARVALKEDKWITAVEILPSDPTVVHHVITYKMKGFDFDPTEGWIGGWAAGLDPMIFPEDTGRFFPRGSNLIADMHYHPSGKPAKDSTRIGLHFLDKEPAKELVNVWIMNDNFKIPAHAENHEVRMSKTFWQAGKIVGFTPHMHYRGKDFTYTAKYPDGTEEVLFAVDNYDFNWQTAYELEEPISIPAGTVVECVAHYNNSASNPFNPDPTIDVTFGDESYDEMMIGFLDFVVDEGVRPLSNFAIRSRMIPELAEQYPGHVYQISGRPEADRDKPDAYAPLHLPKTGDGVFYVIFGDRGLIASKVHSIEWSGKKFSAKVASPYGDLDFVGKLQGSKIDTTLIIPGDEKPQEIKFDGERVGP